MMNVDGTVVLEADRSSEYCSSDEDGVRAPVPLTVPAVPSTLGTFKLNGCTDFQVGNKTVYNGNVSIKQTVIVPEGKKGRREYLLCEGVKLGEEFVHSSRDFILQGSTDSIRKIGPFQRWQGCFLQASLVLLTLSLLLCVTSWIVYDLFSHKSVPPKPSPPGIPLPPHKTNINKSDFPTTLKNGLGFVPRSIWTSKEPSEMIDYKVPWVRVIVEHTAGETCSDSSVCISLIQNIQNYHISLEFGDIGYNFLIGGDALVYVGVGWDKVGAHTGGHNTGSLGIALMGNFVSVNASDVMLDTLWKLIEFGVDQGKIRKDYKLYGHCQWISTLSPGKMVFRVIKKWPHWDSFQSTNCQ